MRLLLKTQSWMVGDMISDMLAGRNAGCRGTILVRSGAHEARDEADVTRPDVVATLDRLGRYLEDLPEVGKVVSLADLLSQIHAGFTDGSPDVIPDDQALIAQYLMLLSSVE